MRISYQISLTFIISTCSLPAFCQSKSTVNSLVSAINNNRNRLPVEKLYLQLDKGNYIQGDTIWFKAYLLDADFLVPSARSGLLYVELDDSENKNVSRMLLPLAAGLSWGNLALDEKDIPEGSYTLRAYTNWMRNFGEDYVFKKNIYIASAGSRSRLVEAGFKEVNNNIQANLLLTDQNSRPVRLQDMQLRVMNGKHTLFKNDVATDINGRLDVNFPLADNIGTKNLSIVTKEANKGEGTKSLTIPVIINRPANIDLQFMPEGGNLVSGIPARIGLKAISEDGNGTPVSGGIYNSKQQEITSFKSIHQGMGSFELTPQAGETYTARLNLPDGTTKNYPLPAVNALGTSLRVSSKSGDSLEVRVAAKATAPADYYLIGEARGVVCYTEHLTPTGETVVRLISKGLFPTGITHFTLLDAANRPLNERIIYIDHHDNLQINITTDKQSYAPHDSIALHIRVTDKTGKPVKGSFSMSVTDDSQVKTDSLGSNILNNLLLTSDLKGTVEEPGYYFEHETREKAAELDDLLLTQGWVGYDWGQVYGPVKPPAFAAEPEFAVHGIVTNIFNKPVAKSGVMLLSKNPQLLLDTVTGNDGRFTFKGLLPVDTASFFIQARNKHGKSFNVGIDVDEFKPPVFTSSTRQVTPWYVNTDTLLLHNRDSKQSQRLAEEKLQGTHLLKEVTVNEKKVIKDSKNLNGPGEADQIFDEKDLEKAGKKTLGDLLQEKVPGYTVSSMYYMIKDKRISFIFDGIPIDKFFTGGTLNDYYLYIKDKLEYTAEDIKGIEVMAGTKYANEYCVKYLGPMADPSRHAFIEITTRSGSGPFMKPTTGVYVYKPLPFTLPKQFYSPRYNIKAKVTGADLRSTIYWEPNIVTDTAGKATVSFYTADKPAGYTIIMQGSDLKGQIGFAQKGMLIH